MSGTAKTFFNIFDLVYTYMFAYIVICHDILIPYFLFISQFMSQIMPYFCWVPLYPLFSKDAVLTFVIEVTHYVLEIYWSSHWHSLSWHRNAFQLTKIKTPAFVIQLFRCFIVAFMGIGINEICFLTKITHTTHPPTPNPNPPATAHPHPAYPVGISTLLFINLSFTHLLVQHTSVAELTHHHLFKWWIIACLAKSHYLNQWWLLINHTPMNEFQWKKN